MEFSLEEVRTATGAQVVNASPEWSCSRVRGWSIDSRTITEGDLFFAVKGEHHDGHRFVPEVLERGAMGALVSEPAEIKQGPLLIVEDTIDGLQKLARWAREQWNHPAVAVTGSAGKTTTKDIIAELLSARFSVAKTIGNFNNHIGLPLTLLRIPRHAEIGVFELGMNHAGEIRDLAAICQPQVGVVTNVGYAHVEAFDNGIDGITAAKRELIEALPVSGTAVLNADDERVLRFREVHKGVTITYGFSEQANVRATRVSITNTGAAFEVNGIGFKTALTGRHSVSNILAGIAVASVFGIKPAELVGRVGELQPGKMRGERSAWNGITILNDSYNANPEAARNMIDVLQGEPAQRRIAVLGEMLELGRLAEQLHREVGAYVANAGVDVVVGVRGVSRSLVDEAKKSGVPHHAAFFFEDPESAGTFLRGFVRAGDAILFKGSRGTRVERALATMKE